MASYSIPTKFHKIGSGEDPVEPIDPKAPIPATDTPGVRLNSSWMLGGLQEYLYPVVSPLPKDRLPPEPPIVLEDAEIRWGKASQFAHSSRQSPNIKYSVRVKDDDEEDDEEPQVPKIVLTELPELRKTSTIRVTAEADPEVWVDVGRIDDATFGGQWNLPAGKDGQPYSGPVQVQLIMKHPTAPKAA